MIDRKTAALLERVSTTRVMPATLMDLVPVERAGYIERHRSPEGYLSWSVTPRGADELDGFRVAVAS